MAAEYVDYRFAGYRLKIVPEFRQTRFLEICCETGEGEHRSGWEPVGSSPFAEVHRFEYERELYYHKKYLKRGWLEAVKARVFGSRARRAWRAGCLLQGHGLGTPDIVTAGWRGSDCFMVTRAAVGARALGQCVRQLKKMPASRQARRTWRKLAEELGRAVGRMHNRRIAHGDLRWGNILVVEMDEETVRFVFLDNERTVRHRRLPARKVLKNLVQLNMIPEGLLSRTDRMRFWQAYRAETGMSEGEQKQWARWVIARTRQRWARRAKKNREP